jgi:hypothetical protein
MTTQNRERLAQIETEARRMAQSGAYRSFRAIVERLLERGYVEASKVFRNRWTQEEINRLCDMSCHKTGFVEHSRPGLQHVAHTDAR